MDKELKKDSLRLAGRYYRAEDYQGKGVLSQGLATTHEQVSDAYMEGEILAVADDINGKDISLTEEPDKGGEK